MSRSKHTDPRLIRAARCIGAPFKRRSAGDMSLRRERGRMLKELAAVMPQEDEVKPRRGHLRIITRQPKSGFHHPIGKGEVLEFLKSLGPLAIYGVRLVELVRSPTPTGKISLIFGRYEVPGRILLYEQPASPWHLPGLLKDVDAARFKRFGAIVTVQPGRRTTLVEWPENALKRFMLEDVLLHELGHHVLQQHKGKRPVRIARTRDHEAFALQFAARQRRRLRAIRFHS